MGATIGHIILSVSRLKESVLDSLFLKWRKNGKHRPFNRDIGLDHLAFKVKGKTKVDEVFRLVSKSNAKITIAPKPYPEYSDKYYAFYFRDPDGIPLEVAAF